MNYSDWSKNIKPIHHDRWLHSEIFPLYSLFTSFFPTGNYKMQGLLIYSTNNFGKAISIGQEMTIFSKTGTRDFCLEDEILFIALFLQLWFIIFLAQKRYYSHLPVTHLKHTSFFQSCYVSLYKYIIIYLTSSKLIVI